MIVPVSDDDLAEASRWLLRVHSADAAEADFAAWQEWLADPVHAKAYEAAEAVWSLAAQLKPLPAPDNAERHPQAPAGAASRPTRVRGVAGLRRGLVAFGVAATLAIGVVGVGWIGWHRLPNSVETGTAEQRSVRLPDGSRVTLAAETRLVVDLRSDQRNVRLERGEAYFEVAHDASRPFVVRADGHEVVAIGTAFDVQTNAGRMTVTVTQGVVGLRARPGIEPSSHAFIGSPALQLRIGERALADEEGLRRLPPAPRPEAVVSWREGRLEYLHASLQVVIDDVNRYTDRKLVIPDPTVGALQFTGTVILEDLEAWIAALPRTFSVQIHTRGKTRVIEPAPGTVDARPDSAAPRPY